jgi:hypothetical protein
MDLLLPHAVNPVTFSVARFSCVVLSLSAEASSNFCPELREAMDEDEDDAGTAPEFSLLSSSIMLSSCVLSLSKESS